MTFNVMSNSPCVLQGNTKQFGRRIYIVAIYRKSLRAFFPGNLLLISVFNYTAYEIALSSNAALIFQIQRVVTSLVQSTFHFQVCLILKPELLKLLLSSRKVIFNSCESALNEL